MKVEVIICFEGKWVKSQAEAPSIERAAHQAFDESKKKLFEKVDPEGLKTAQRRD